MLLSHNGDYQFFDIGTKIYSCYAVTYKDKAVMIDAGPLSEREAIEKLRDAFRPDPNREDKTLFEKESEAIEKNLEKDFLFDFDAIFLTHVHGDTAGNAEYFSMLYNCPVYCMKDALLSLQRGVCKRPAKDHPYIKKAGPAGSVVPKLPAFVPFEPCQNAQPLTRQVAEEYLGKDVQLLMTPGHCEDSISLRIGDTALIGDAAQFNKRVLAPVFVDNEAQLARTWETLIGLSCKQYLSAHGRPFSFEEWLKNK